MKFLSVDIETTGLDPNKHGVIQIGAAYADLYDDSFETKTWQMWVNPEGMVWSVYCLNLHKDWLKVAVPRIMRHEYEVEGEVTIKASLDNALDDLRQWVIDIQDVNKGSSVVPAGKNFAGFDKQFLEKAFCCPKFKHRTLDPAAYYTRKGDAQPPDLALCKRRAIEMGLKIDWAVAHTALEDALDVVALLKFGAKRAQS